MKVVCLVQARVGSTRLPGKILKEICGKTILHHEIDRLKKCKEIDEIVIATTDKKDDDKIVNEAKKLSVKYFRGSENDVLSRFYYAAKENNADIIVRVTSDCPCIDFEILDKMLIYFKDKYKEKQVDYLSNTIKRTYPRGYDIEIFTFSALEKSYINAKKEYEREHVTPYIYDKTNNFLKLSFENKDDYSEYRVTLDTIEDFIVIKNIFENLYYKNPYFKLNDVVQYLNNNLHIVDINKHIEQKKLGE